MSPNLGAFWGWGREEINIALCSQVTTKIKLGFVQINVRIIVPAPTLILQSLPIAMIFLINGIRFILRLGLV